MSKELVKKLVEIQSTLKAPKSQFNKFGNYAYRNCEDILEAVKPLLAEQGLVLTLSDEVVSSGYVTKQSESIMNSPDGTTTKDSFSENREYVKVTATITDGEASISATAVARESYEKKGMDSAQISGSASSYARKYALNGLFLIDDTKDADSTNDHGKKETAKSSARKPKEDKKETKEAAPKTSTRGRTRKDPVDSKKEEPTQEKKEEPAKSGSSFRRRR